MIVGLCLAMAGAITTSLPVDRFTLSWAHSVEKVRWEEDWRVDPDRHLLALVESRIQGSGAGMEPPEGAILRNGTWHASGNLELRRLRLALSDYAGDWELCTAGTCRALAAWTGRRAGTVEAFACPIRDYRWPRH